MNKTNKYLLAPISLAGITVLSGALLLSSSAFANNDSVVDQVSITVPISCTLSGSGMTSHTASIPNGTYTPDIGTTTLTAFCNDNAGFSIYAAGYTGDEIGATNSTKLVGTSASNNATIDTGTATGPVSGNDTSNWAMKLTALSNPTPTYPITITSDTSGSFSSYHAVPSEYTKVATRTSGTDIGQSAEGSTLTTTYAAYISKTQAADTYTGQVIYTLVHPANAPAPVVCNPSGTTIGTNASTDIKCMQDISSTNKSSILTSMTLEQQYTLKDKRDGKDYMVAKLADGNIWMTQNLDLDLDSSRTYTNLDTDIGYNTSTGQYDTAAWTPSTTTYPTSTTTWNNSKTTPESYDPGTLYWNGTANTEYPSTEADCTAAGGAWDSVNGLCNFISSTGNSHYHLGNYYNWTAAIAMNDSSSYTTQYQDVNQSICPANWTLPKGGNVTTSGSFQYLITQYGWDSSSQTMTNPNIWNSPIKSSLSGVWSGSLEFVGAYDYFWSPMVDDSDFSYGLYADSDGGVVPVIGDRDYGSSVRCVARW